MPQTSHQTHNPPKNDQHAIHPTKRSKTIYLAVTAFYPKTIPRSCRAVGSVFWIPEVGKLESRIYATSSFLVWEFLDQRMKCPPAMSNVWSIPTLSSTSSAPTTIRPRFSSVFLRNSRPMYLLLLKKHGKPVVERVQWFCGIPRQPA